MSDQDTPTEDVQPKPVQPQVDEPADVDDGGGESTAQPVPSDPIEDDEQEEVSTSAHAAVRSMKRNMIRPVDTEL